MGSHELRAAKTKFSSLLDEIQPIVAQFVVWLDEKVAEYKVQGYMNLDSGSEAPKWIKDYSMSLIVSGMSQTTQTTHEPSKSPLKPDHHKARVRMSPKRGLGDADISAKKKIRRAQDDHDVGSETQLPNLPGPSSAGDADFEIIEIKEEQLEDDDYLQSWSHRDSSVPDYSTGGNITPNIAAVSQQRLPNRTSMDDMGEDLHDPSGFDDESYDDGETGHDVKFAFKNTDSLPGDASYSDMTDPASASTSYAGLPGYERVSGDVDGTQTQVSLPCGEKVETITLPPDKLKEKKLAMKLKRHKTYPCGHCNAVFAREYNLQRHVRRHSGNNEFRCTTCNHYFDSADKQLEHIARKHSDPHLCIICGNIFKTKISLRIHSLKHPAETGLHRAKFTCPYADCGKMFLFKNRYEDHVNVHTGKKPFSCGKCEKGFNNRDKRAEHERLCRGETFHTCHICSKSFTTNSTLQGHIKSVHLNQKYFCGCGQEYANKTSLSRHRRINDH